VVDHHWTGITPDPLNNWGFIYIIRDVTTGQGYVGRKQYFFAKQGAKGCKSRVVDRSSPKWKCSCWIPSNWKTYKGSSKILDKHMATHPDHEYTFEIIHQCHSRGELSYWEVRYQWELLVLTARLPDGTRQYFNGNIGGIKFIPKAVMDKATKLKVNKRQPKDGD